MRIGDLVRYRGWSKGAGPMALIVYESNIDSDYHHRIRVMWIDKEIPVQAAVLSTEASRITSWVSPKYFEVISETG
jgi:hypothetical protein